MPSAPPHPADVIRVDVLQSAIDAIQDRLNRNDTANPSWFEGARASLRMLAREIGIEIPCPLCDGIAGTPLELDRHLMTMHRRENP